MPKVCQQTAEPAAFKFCRARGKIARGRQPKRRLWNMRRPSRSRRLLHELVASAPGELRQPCALDATLPDCAGRARQAAARGILTGTGANRVKWISSLTVGIVQWQNARLWLWMSRVRPPLPTPISLLTFSGLAGSYREPSKSPTRCRPFSAA